MAGTRGVGARSAGTRAQIVRAARQVMADSGYRAVTYRAVATRAGCVPGLVQYHFPELDTLLVAVVEAGTEETIARVAELGEQARPLRALWRHVVTDTAGTALLGQLMALAAHSPAVGVALGRGGQQVRAALIAMVEKAWPAYPIPDIALTPAALVFTITAVRRMLCLESAYGAELGHADTIAFIEDLLDRLEPDDEKA